VNEGDGHQCKNFGRKEFAPLSQEDAQKEQSKHQNAASGGEPQPQRLSSPSPCPDPLQSLGWLEQPCLMRLSTYLQQSSVDSKCQGEAPIAVLGQDKADDSHWELTDPETVEKLGLRYEGAFFLPFGVLGGLDIGIGEPSPQSRNQRRNDSKNAAVRVDFVSRKTQKREADQGQHRGRENCSFHGCGRRPELGWFLHGRKRRRQTRQAGSRGSCGNEKKATRQLMWL